MQEEALVGEYQSKEQLSELVGDALLRVIIDMRTNGKLGVQGSPGVGAAKAEWQVELDALSSSQMEEYRRSLVGWLRKWQMVSDRAKDMTDIKAYQQLLSEVGHVLFDNFVRVLGAFGPEMNEVGDRLGAIVPPPPLRPTLRFFLTAAPRTGDFRLRPPTCWRH